MYKINDFRKVEGKKNLKGYADVYDTDKNWMIAGCSVFANGDQYWVNMPSTSYKNEQGETKYKDIIQMQKEEKDQFSKQVMEALKQYNPNAPKPFEFKKPEKKSEENYEFSF